MRPASWQHHATKKKQTVVKPEAEPKSSDKGSQAKCSSVRPEGELYLSQKQY